MLYTSAFLFKDVNDVYGLTHKTLIWQIIFLLFTDKSNEEVENKENGKKKAIEDDSAEPSQETAEAIASSIVQDIVQKASKG